MPAYDPDVIAAMQRQQAAGRTEFMSYDTWNAPDVIEHDNPDNAFESWAKGVKGVANPWGERYDELAREYFGDFEDDAMGDSLRPGGSITAPPAGKTASIGSLRKQLTALEAQAAEEGLDLATRL